MRCQSMTTTGTWLHIGDLFNVAESAAAVILNEVCKVLVSTFYDQFVNLPEDSAKLKQELKNVLENCEFPCVGA